MLKMSTGRRASVLAIFAIFLCEYIDKTNKKVHNKFTNEYRHTGTGLARDLREYRETGCESPTQKRHCKVYVLSDGAAARSLAEAGKALRKEWAFAPHTESGYSVPSLFGGFPAGAYASA